MMEKEYTTVGEFVEEQLLDVYRGDIHKILSNVHRDLESLGCKKFTYGRRTISID